MKKDILEKITEYPEKCELDDSLVADAKQTAQELYGKKKGKRKILVRGIAIACIFVTVFAIALPLYFHFRREEVPQIVYNDETLTEYDLADVGGFLSGNGYTALFYTGENVYSLLYKFTDTDEDAFIKQTLMSFTESSFDIVELYICLSKKKFSRFEGFKQMETTGSLEISGIKVNYTTIFDDGSYAYYLTFATPTTEHYMKIDTQSSVEAVENYLRVLIGE